VATSIQTEENLEKKLPIDHVGTPDLSRRFHENDCGAALALSKTQTRCGEGELKKITTRGPEISEGSLASGYSKVLEALINKDFTSSKAIEEMIW